jgi:hypothetical protein
MSPTSLPLRPLLKKYTAAGRVYSTIFAPQQAFPTLFYWAATAGQKQGLFCPVENMRPPEEEKLGTGSNFRSF